MAKAFRDQIQFYHEEFGLSLPEAHAEATAPAHPEDVTRLMNTPADRLCCQDLTRLTKASPEKGMALWGRVKQAAREELSSGQHAATVVDPDRSPWMRTQFLVLYESLLQQ